MPGHDPAMSGLPDDFNSAEYLRLHKDVADARLDAGYHYLAYGRSEGRPYRASKSPISGGIQSLTTMVLTKTDVFRQRLGTETLLVTGASRGATSLVAYALLRLGYPLRADQPTNHELTSLANSKDDFAAIASVVETENLQHVRWGFKLPAAALSIDWYARNLRAPVVMMVSRNPLAIARSVQKHEPAWDAGAGGLFAALQHAERYLAGAGEAVRCPAPAILVDIDLSQREPETFVRELASLFDLPFNADVAAEIAVPGYRSVMRPRP